MKRRLLLTITAAAPCILLGASVKAWRTSRERANAAAAEAASLRSDVAELQRLRGTASVDSRAPAIDVLTLTNDALSRCSVDPARLASLSPQPDLAALGGASPRRLQVVRIVLEPLTLAELGAFLQAIEDAQSVWSFESIDLHVMPGPSAALSCRLVASAPKPQSEGPR